MSETTWVKDCTCNSTSSTNQLRYFEIARDDAGHVKMRGEFIPGPSCDKCGRAWKPVVGGGYYAKLVDSMREQGAKDWDGKSEGPTPEEPAPDTGTQPR